MTPSAFWQLFAAEEKQLFQDSDTSRVLDRISCLLARYNPGLSAEISDDEVCRELIVTADGDPRLFRVVEDLIEAAPHLMYWRVIALKPPRGFDFSLDFDGVSIVPSELFFDPLKSGSDPTAIGIRVFAPGASRLPGIREGMRQAVEIGLGERLA